MTKRRKAAQHTDLYDLFGGLCEKINRIFQTLTVDILGWSHGHNRLKDPAQMIGRT